MFTRTKIVCTMGPSVQSYEKIGELIDAGMNVARLNFSHGNFEQHGQIIANLKRARKEKGVPLAIMLDTKGPEIRLGEIEGKTIEVVPGSRVFLAKKEPGLIMTPALVFDSLVIGTTLLFDDGYISAIVVEKNERGIVVEVQNKGKLKSRSGVNVPNVPIPLPAMTEEDRKSIAFACKEGVDMIAASFIRSSDHVLEIKELLQAEGKPDLFLIAKIEDIQGVQNFEEILRVADGIMVARGDLGVELPLPEVPSLQKMMIRRCYSCSKPVITATQMLESMIQNPRPTRAEVSDVANAIYDSTSAIMLSGETAVGLYPIETIRMMRSIVLEAEKRFDYREFFYRDSRTDYQDVSFSVALGAVKTAYSIGAKAIFALTHNGFTARQLSRFRPEIPVYALSSTEEAYHRMALLWGVIPVPPRIVKDVEEALLYISDFVKQQGMQKGDPILITAGAPFGISGTTNMMIVSKVS